MMNDTGFLQSLKDYDKAEPLAKCLCKRRNKSTSIYHSYTHKSHIYIYACVYVYNCVGQSVWMRSGNFLHEDEVTRCH